MRPEILFIDKDILVALKPPGVLSTDEPGGMPELLRAALNDSTADIRTVHRLDRVVSGVMVFARSAAAASELSRQVRENIFSKDYIAVVHSSPAEPEGVLRDLLRRDKRERKTYVVTEMDRDTRPAELRYRVLGSSGDLTLLRIQLITGRTHQIRAQFSSRGMPLAGDRKYSTLPDDCPIALWSERIGFLHPSSGEQMEFTHSPPEIFPWTEFSSCI